MARMVLDRYDYEVWSVRIFSRSVDLVQPFALEHLPKPDGETGQAIATLILDDLNFFKNAGTLDDLWSGWLALCDRWPRFYSSLECVPLELQAATRMLTPSTCGESISGGEDDERTQDGDV